MDEFTYLVAGVPDTAARELTRARPFSGPITVRRSVLDLPGRHGTTPSGGPVIFDDSKLSLTWELQAPTWAALEVERLALMALLGAPGDIVVTRRIGSVDLAAAHRLVSATGMESDTGMPLATVTAVLSAPGVFWRGQEFTSEPVAASAGTVTLEVPELAGSTAPVADAVVRASGPLTSVSLNDVPSGTGLSWSGSLSVGAFLFMDARTLRAWTSTDGAAWTGSATDATGGIDYPPAGPLQLWPAMTATDPTDRRVSITVDGTGRGSGTAVAVRARPAYL